MACWHAPPLANPAARPPPSRRRLPAFFTSSLKLERASSPAFAAGAAPATKPAGGSENGSSNGNSAAQLPPACGSASAKGTGILLAALERRGSGLIAAVRAKQQ